MDEGLRKEAARRARMAELEERITTLAAHTHAAMAELAKLAAAYNDDGGWAGDGHRCFASWLSLSAGFSPRTGVELVRVGQAMSSLPQLSAAFTAGTLSFDSMRELSSVATPEDEHLWLEVAASATGDQLSRICRACRRVADVDSRRHSDEQLSRRGVWAHHEDDGMLSVRALLLPEEGALLQAALESAMRTEVPPPVPADDDGRVAVVPPEHSWAARRADALVAVCEHALAAGDGGLRSDPAALPMVVHVDVGVLTGADPDGRRHLEGGPVLSTATIRKLGCDASVIAITERDGLPINVGRTTRILPRALRRAVQGRDRTCRFPGCAVPARRTHAHHIKEWWADGGTTDLHNLLSLCNFHHHRVHDGTYAIHGTPGVDLWFAYADGKPVLRPPRPVDPGVPREQALRSSLPDGEQLDIDADTAARRDVNPRINLGYVVDVLIEGTERARDQHEPDEPHDDTLDEPRSAPADDASAEPPPAPADDPPAEPPSQPAD